MIKLREKQEIIIRNLLNGESLRSISRSTGISRRIVTKYVKQYLAAKSNTINLNNNENKEEFVDSIVEPPKYNSSNRKKRKITPEIIEEVKKCLNDNQKKKRFMSA